MTKTDSKFYKGAILIFLMSSALIFSIQYQKPELTHTPTTWISQILLFSIILISHFIASRGLKDKGQDFHVYYMGSLTVRFLIAVFYLFLIVYFYLDHGMVIVINFFILYFVYTSFEIYSLLANLRAENKRR